MEITADGLHAVITRSKAKLAGLNKYFTGKPCVWGHISQRETCSGQCLECSKIRRAKPSSIEKAKARTKAHYAKNRQKKLDAAKNPSDERRKQLALNTARWRKNNPEKARANRRASQALRRAKGAGVTPEEMRKWVDLQKKICYWCGVKCEKNYHVDHYQPLALDGRHAVENLVISCARCNLRKRAKDPYEFAATVGRLF